MFCKFCGKQLIDNAVFCSNCGKQLIIKNENQNEDLIAKEIQKEHKKYKPVESPKSRLIAALLAFFFGDLGAHRFYVGRYFSAIIQMILGLSFIISLLLLWFGELEESIFVYFAGILWSFWIVIDFLMILCGVFKDKDKLPVIDWGL